MLMIEFNLRSFFINEKNEKTSCNIRYMINAAENNVSTVFFRSDTTTTVSKRGEFIVVSLVVTDVVGNISG